VFFLRPRFSVLADEVLKQKRIRAPATFAAAELRLGRLTEYFGRMRVSQITETTWQAYIEYRRAERANTKFFDDRKYMRQVLALAEKRGLVPRIIDLWIPDVPSCRGREIPAGDLLALLRAARPELHFQIEIAVKMGLRLREMLKLRWEQIDWERRIVLLSPEDTKTRRGRQVPIPPDLFDRFRSRLAHRKHTSPFVFPRPRDPSRPCHDNKSAWRRCKALAGVPNYRFHDLRHTCASRMLRRGVSTAIASRILGMSERVLLRIYHHVNTEDLHRAAALMSDGGE
jgi:integrase